MYLSLSMLSTLLLWVFFAMILGANARHPLNRLCFCGGMLFSLGTFKESFYYDLAPGLLAAGVGTEEGMRTLYSLMTSALYLCAMPAACLFAVRFRGCSVSNKKLIGWMLLPAAALMILFPPTRTYFFQRQSLPFWVAMCLYNLTYGLLFTFFLLQAVKAEPTREVRRQKRFVALMVLPLLWYWLVTIFVFHTLGLQSLLRAWTGIFVLVCVEILIYLYLAFTEGVMGVRLNAEHYQWESESRAALRGAQFLSHALRRDLVKLAWCAKDLEEHQDPPSPQLRILRDTIERLQNLSDRILLHSGRLTPKKEPYPLEELLEGGLLEEYREKGMKLTTEFAPGDRLFCDPCHLRETLRNLLENAWEAKGEGCAVQIRFRPGRRGERHSRYDLLTVEDNGPGIPASIRERMFFPYQTEKSDAGHLGLGLYYCYRVMQAHGGWIQCDSAPDRGSAFRLYFPKEG